METWIPVNLLHIILFLFTVDAFTPYRRVDDPRPICPHGSLKRKFGRRVVGGRDAEQVSFPYSVGIIKLKKDGRAAGDDSPLPHPYCEGLLITDKHIVTAAHCLEKRDPDQLRLDVGDYDLTSDDDGPSYIRTITSTTIHSAYNNYDNDIAILKMNESVPLGDRLKVACLAPRGVDLSPGTMTTVAGWGRLKYKGRSSQILQEVQVPVMSRKDCQKPLVTRVTTNMMCAGGIPGKDACVGDSGGGLTIRLDDDYMVVGLVSFGRNCALPHVAGVYTLISRYSDWIYDKIADASCQPCFVAQNEISTYTL